MSHHLSYWEKSVLLRPFDFAVLGAGLTGKQVAIKIKLKYPGARICMIDRSPISYGASTRNAGFACFGSVSEICDDIDRSSKEKVIALAIKRYKGIQALIGEYGAGNIGYRNTGSYEIFTGKAVMEMAMANYREINQWLTEAGGLKEVFSITDTAKFGFKSESNALFNPYEGMLNTGMLNETINEKAQQLGIIPLYGLDITSLEENSDSYTLHSKGGLHVNCKQLIIANNAFAGPFLPQEDIIPSRGQIIITKPLDEIPFDGIFHSDKGYLYFRNIDNRILIGGGRNKFAEQETSTELLVTENIKTFLENYLKEVVIPGVPFETDMQWSGIMAMGSEKVPIVKRVNRHLLVCVRMSGMGVALGPVLSDELAELV